MMERPPQQEIQKKPFLHRMKKFVALTGAVAAMHEGVAQAEDRPTTAEMATESAMDQQIYEELMSVVNHVGEITDIMGKPGHRAMARESEARVRAQQAKIPEATKAIVHDLVKIKESSQREIRFIQLVEDLVPVHLQGVAFSAFVQEFGELPVETGKYFFGSYAADFIPTGTQVTPEHIDPRWHGISEIGGKTGEAILKTIESEEGWSSNKRIDAFKHLLDQKDIRSLAVETDMTLAELFGTIKATMVEFDSLQQASADSDEEFRSITEMPISSDRKMSLIARLIREKQQAFERQEILDVSTDALLIYTGNDHDSTHGVKNMFDGHAWERIANAAGVNSHVIHSFDASTERPEKAATGFLYGIGDSHGKTVITIDTHGLPNGLTVDTDTPNTKMITPKQIAIRLVDRVQATKDIHSLAQVTMISDACFSHDFARNLSAEIQAEWATRAPSFSWASGQKMIDVPIQITTAQEGSFGFIDYGFSPILDSQTDGISADGGLNGRRLLELVQPKAAPYTDMTFFLPRSSGKGMMEVGSNEQSQNPFRPV